MIDLKFKYHGINYFLESAMDNSIDSCELLSWYRCLNQKQLHYIERQEVTEISLQIFDITKNHYIIKNTKKVVV